MRKTFDAELLELSRELTSMAATARDAIDLVKMCIRDRGIPSGEAGGRGIHNGVDLHTISPPG